MKSLSRLRTLALAAVATAAACLLFSVSAHAAAPYSVGAAQPVTVGASYDRNGTIVRDGSSTWLYYAGSESPCDRIATIGACDADSSDYGLYSQLSLDGGATWDAPKLEAANPHSVLPPPFRGRTVAATRRADGTVDVFWASGANGSTLLQFTKAVGAGALSPGSVVPAEATADSTQFFNVEAVAKGDAVHLYTQETGTAPGIYERTLAAGVYSAATKVPASDDLAIPKVIVGKDDRFYMAMVSPSTGDVYVSSSDDGVEWGTPALTVEHAGSDTNWDPSLAQTSDGRFYLFYAPDHGDGAQGVAFVEGTDFANWSSPQEIETGTLPSTTEKFWEYWPEAIPTEQGLRLVFTSERPQGHDTAGTGHLFSQTIKRDGDGDGIADPVDCAPGDGARPAAAGADANCDGTVDPAPVTPPVTPPVVPPVVPPASQPEPTPTDADLDGLPDVADCAPQDGTKPARNGTDSNCDGTVDPPARGPTLVLCSTGSPGPDLLVCAGGKQRIDGLAGNDVISMGSGDDIVYAGSGSDMVLGQGGSDKLFGQADDDSLDGGTGRDTLSGGAGVDSLVGGAGNDRLIGGSGADIFRAGDGRDIVNAADGRPGDVISCGAGRDRVSADRRDVVSADCERVTRRAARARR